MGGNVVEREVKLGSGITCAVEGKKLTVSGQGKTCEMVVKAEGVSVEVEGSRVLVKGRPASRKMNALVNTIASQIESMGKGIERDFVYRMAVVYSHFPMNVAVKGNAVEINNFVGEKKARVAKIVPNARVSVKGKEVVVKSHDKRAAGQTAANIENATKVKGKDTRIYQDGIFIVERAVQEELKEGKNNG